MKIDENMVLESAALLHETVVHISSVLSSLGLPRTSAVILAFLYVAGRPLDCVEISKSTGYSRSSISQAMKHLEAQRLVLRIKHGRRGLYKPSLRLSHLLVELYARTLEGARARLRRLREDVRDDTRLAELEEELGAALRVVGRG